MLRQGSPSLQVRQWNELGEHGEFAFGALAYTENDRPFLGDMLVAIAQGSALWFGYTAPEADYSRVREKALLDGFINSFEGDAGSKMPAGEIPDLVTARLDRNAKAFIFVLEVYSGIAFTEVQERVISDELVKAWRDLPAADRAQYDKYPAVMKALLVLKQEDLARLQAQMKDGLRQILGESDQTPAIKIIRDQLDKNEQVLVAGKPPLTAAAADAYAELMGFTKALSAKPNAGPEDIPEAVVNQIKPELVASWKGFSDQDKQAVLGTPALWMAVRMTFRQGTAAERQQVRQSLHKLAGQAGLSSAGSGNAGHTATAQAAGSAAAHQTLMMMQQQTFNTYMWSRGFSGWTPTGKTW